VIAKNEMTFEVSLIGALKTRDSSGSMGSQMRCTVMLQNVASDNKKIARRVVGDSAFGVAWGGWVSFFKAVPLYLLLVGEACRP
jgi:hypothetical protein